MKKKTIIFLAVFFVLAALFVGGYLWIKTDVPEMEFQYGADETYADWRLEKDGTATVFGSGRLPWLETEYRARLFRDAEQGSVYAFLKQKLDGCPIKRVVIGRDVTVSPEAEEPTGVGYAFRSCDSLREIAVESGNPSLSDMDGVLFNKDGTELLFYPSCRDARAYAVPETVASIAADAFIGHGRLSSVSFPDGLREIGEEAFLGCTALKTVILPAGLERVGQYAFSDCLRLKTVEVPSGVRSIGAYAFGFSYGVWTANGEPARVTGFRLLCGDDAGEAKAYAQTYGIGLEIIAADA